MVDLGLATKATAAFAAPTRPLSPAIAVLSCDRMAYLTLQAVIEHGRITVSEPDKLPATGKALLTVLDSPEHKPDWNKVMSLLGTAENKLDGLAVERAAREEWDERERKQWGHR